MSPKSISNPIDIGPTNVGRLLAALIANEERTCVLTTDLVTYLSFDGQCEAAFKFYEEVLRGEILMMMHHADAPAGSGVPQTSDTANRIMHARLKVGDRLLMGGDAPKQFASNPQGFCANIIVDDPTEADRIFHTLAEGGAVRMPIAETFWARRFGMLIDKFGIPWMVNCEKQAA